MDAANGHDINRAIEGSVCTVSRAVHGLARERSITIPWPAIGTVMADDGWLGAGGGRPCCVPAKITQKNLKDEYYYLKSRQDPQAGLVETSYLYIFYYERKSRLRSYSG